MDALKTCMAQSVPEKMAYVYIVFAVVDALNIAFGNSTKEDAINSGNHSLDPDTYDYSYWSVALSDEITKRIEGFKAKLMQNGAASNNGKSQA